MIGSHRIRTAWRCTGSSSSVDSSTPSAVTTATSLSSRITTSRVWERIAGMSEAMNISPRPSPTTTLPAPCLAAISRSGAAGDDADRVGSGHLGEGRLHRALEPARRRQVMLDEVGEHLGVGLGPERVALAAEAVLDLEVVLEDPVVDDDEVAAAVGVGVGVLVRGPAVGRPARVAHPERPPHPPLAEDPLERLEAPGGAADVERPVVEHRHAGGVAAAVLAPLEPLDDDRHRVLVAHVTDDPAHG